MELKQIKKREALQILSKQVGRFRNQIEEFSTLCVLHERNMSKMYHKINAAIKVLEEDLNATSIT